MGNATQGTEVGLSAVEKAAVADKLRRRLEIRVGSHALKDDGEMPEADAAEWEQVKAKIREQLERPGWDWQMERDRLEAENEKYRAVIEWVINLYPNLEDGINKIMEESKYDNP